MECNTVLYSVIPDFYIGRVLQIGEIIVKMEQICKDLLKCNKTRVFIVSDMIVGMQKGCLGEFVCCVVCVYVSNACMCVCVHAYVRAFNMIANAILTTNTTTNCCYVCELLFV